MAKKPAPKPVVNPYAGPLQATDPTEMLGGVPADNSGPVTSGSVTNPSLPAYQAPAATTPASTPANTTTNAANAGTPNDPNYANEMTADGVINQVLTQYGLGSLSTWAWNQVINLGLTGLSDPTAVADEIQLNLQQTPEYQQRFAGNGIRTANGLDALSPTDYITLEDTMNQALESAGIPSSMVPNAVTNAIGADVSASEFQSRLNLGVLEVQKAPPEVGQQFAQMFGVQGPAAMAAYFLNPANSIDTLETQANMAQASGLASMHNIAISKNTAGNIAALGETMDTMAQHYANLNKITGLFNTTQGEAAASASKAPLAPADVTEANQGVNAEFGLSASAQNDMEQRENERVNEFKGTGHASDTQTEGFEGIGSARPV